MKRRIKNEILLWFYQKEDSTMRHQINVFTVTTEFYHQNISSIDVRITSLALFPDQMSTLFLANMLYFIYKSYMRVYIRYRKKENKLCHSSNSVFQKETFQDPLKPNIQLDIGSTQHSGQTQSLAKQTHGILFVDF